LVELAVGFLNEEAAVGRAGGLLSVVPVVVLVIGAEGSFEAESLEVIGFVVGVPKDRLVTEEGFGIGGADSLSAAGCSMVSTGSSMIISLRYQCEGNRLWTNCGDVDHDEDSMIVLYGWVYICGT
jgi:hypothetical protein